MAPARAIRSSAAASFIDFEDLQAWVERGAKASTSDPGVGQVLPAKRHAAVSPAYAGQTRR